MRSALLWLVLSFFLTTSAIADTTITFQGQLDRQGSPYSGQADMMFRLFDAETGGNQIGSDQTVSVTVTSGVFTANIDFGAVFDGTSVWIETLVGSTKLGDRQRITSVPSSVTSLDWSKGNNQLTYQGDVGIGTTNPVGEFQVVGRATFGGSDNIAGGDRSFVGGGSKNLIAGAAGFIGGGLDNGLTSTSSGGFIGGGAGNIVGGSLGSGIVSGAENIVGGNYSVVAGGGGNVITGAASFVSGGLNNTIIGDLTASGIVAGLRNSVSVGGDYSIISGGVENQITGGSSFIASGVQNLAQGDFSFAGGVRAKALHNGTFVWADNIDADFPSSAPQQFLIRANNGVGISTNVSLPANGLGVAGDVVARAYFTRSSEKFKSNIQRYVPSSSLLDFFEAVTYNMTDSSDLHIGVIAEEVQRVAPELVSQNESGEVVGVAYDRLSIALIAALLEEVNTLKSRVEELEKDR